MTQYTPLSWRAVGGPFRLRACVRWGPVAAQPAGITPGSCGHSDMTDCHWPGQPIGLLSSGPGPLRGSPHQTRLAKVAFRGVDPLGNHCPTSSPAPDLHDYSHITRTSNGPGIIAPGEDWPPGQRWCPSVGSHRAESVVWPRPTDARGHSVIASRVLASSKSPIQTTLYWEKALRGFGGGGRVWGMGLGHRRPTGQVQRDPDNWPSLTRGGSHLANRSVGSWGAGWALRDWRTLAAGDPMWRRGALQWPGPRSFWRGRRRRRSRPPGRGHPHPDLSNPVSCIIPQLAGGPCLQLLTLPSADSHCCHPFNISPLLTCMASSG